MTPEHAVLMASYNRWMNAKVYAAAARLDAAALRAERAAFFGSVFGTMNHLVVGDRIWLARFATHPGAHAALDPVREMPLPRALDAILYDDLDALAQHRVLLDEVICRWAEALSDRDLAQVLRYANTKGVVSTRRFASLLMHFFNHQTHHRGQLTTLLSQAGQDVGVTDLLALIADEDDGP
jgi:uncharacterized damage-inducible protein DinB